MLYEREEDQILRLKGVLAASHIIPLIVKDPQATRDRFRPY